MGWPVVNSLKTKTAKDATAAIAKARRGIETRELV